VGHDHRMSPIVPISRAVNPAVPIWDKGNGLRYRDNRAQICRVGGQFLPKVHFGT
jgi:hypothetical protein